jgi:hypothetical protein
MEAWARAVMVAKLQQDVQRTSLIEPPGCCLFGERSEFTDRADGRPCSSATSAYDFRVRIRGTDFRLANGDHVLRTPWPLRRKSWTGSDGQIATRADGIDGAVGVRSVRKTTHSDRVLLGISGGRAELRRLSLPPPRRGSSRKTEFLRSELLLFHFAGWDFRESWARCKLWKTLGSRLPNKCEPALLCYYKEQRERLKRLPSGDHYKRSKRSTRVENSAV